MLLSIETSCDETAVALFDLAPFFDGRFEQRAVGSSDFLRGELISSQVKLHTAYGGVVPELAAREHLKNLPLLIKELFKCCGVKAGDLTAVAVTQGPGLKGSLLVGYSFAQSFAASLDLPCLGVNHLEGHLFAGDLLAPEARPVFPMVALLVSGGHTELVWVESFRSYRVLARTRDDAAGEAFDKSATLLGLPYPGGPVLSRTAESGEPGRFSFPVAVVDDASSFSFSGLKTAVLRRVQEIGCGQQGVSDEKLRADLAYGIEQAIVESLVLKSIAVCKTTPPASFLLTGGVAANRALRSRLSHELSLLGIPFVVPPNKWCTDNAAMIGVCAAQILARSGMVVNGTVVNGRVVGPTLATGNYGGADVGVRARWPLNQVGAM